MKKTILITGCSSGIGLHCALRLHKLGWKVVASARKEQDVAILQDYGLSAIQLDLDDSKSIYSAVEKTLEITDGSLFALFNNAAYGQIGAVEDLSRDVLRKEFETNLLGTQELTNKIIPFMRKQPEGRIIHNSSLLGYICLKYRGAYTASKYALEALADTMRMELADTPIKVTLIEPGPIESNFRKNAINNFKKTIDYENSPYSQYYRKILEEKSKSYKIYGKIPINTFTLQADSVFKMLWLALNMPNPRSRYRVTFPSSFFWYGKKVFSTKVLDFLLSKIT